MVNFLAISNVAHHEDFASLIEVVCSYEREIRLSEWNFDDDELRSSYLEHLRHTPDDSEDVIYNEEAPNACLENAKSFLIENTVKTLKQNAATLGCTYPLDLSKIDNLILSLKPNLCPFSQSYIWLKAHLLFQSENNYFQCETDEEIKKFSYEFIKVFEFIAAFAVLGHFECDVWYTGRVRSSRDFLLLLSKICSKLDHPCEVNEFKNLPPKNNTANDGGVDGIAITKPNGEFCSTSELYLIQATIQKSNLENKVVNAGTIKKFDKFFLQNIRYPKKGIFAVPHEKKDLYYDMCSNEENLYFHRKELLKNIGNLTDRHRSNKLAMEYNDSNLQWPPDKDKFNFEIT